MKYSNPIIAGFHPDPSICRAGEDYYLVTSSFEYFPGVPIFHSRDLVNWEQIGNCLTRKSQLELTKAGPSGGIYAPTIRYNGGRFYMITTNVTGGGNFFVWTDNPEDEWSEPIWIDHNGGIDPSLFFDDDGKVYYTGTASSDSKSGIYQFQIDIENGKKLTQTKFIWGGTGGTCPEGPHLYKINGIYYLIISEGGTEHGHMITAARSNSPFGPFEPCPRNPILTNRSLPTAVKAVGHADLIQAHDGSWWTVCLGIRPVSYPQRHHLGRETFLAPVKWDTDGWPVMGNNGTIDLEMEAEGLQAVKWEEKSIRDDFDSLDLNNSWNFLRNPYENDWSLSERPGSITLKGSCVTLGDVDSPAFIGRRQEHFNVEISTILDFEPLENNEEAGLTVFLNNKHHYDIAITRLENKKCVILRRRIGSLWKVENCITCDEGAIILGVKATPLKYVFTFKEKDKEIVNIGEGESCYLSTEVGGAFTGVYIGLYATGNGKNSTSTAYFDWFDYIPSKDQGV